MCGLCLIRVRRQSLCILNVPLGNFLASERCLEVLYILYFADFLFEIGKHITALVYICFGY